MATTTLPEGKPKEDRNPGQDEFDKIIEKNISSGDERAMEERAKDGAIDDNIDSRGFSNKDDSAEAAKTDEDKSGSAEQEKISEHENQAGRGYRPNKKPTPIPSSRRWLFNKRRAALGGGVVGTIVAIFGFFIFQGPLQFVHIAQLLEQFHFSAQEDQSDDRFTRIARYIHYKGNGQVEKTRLGFLGNKYADKIETRFNAVGVTSTYTPVFGFLDGYNIDPEKFAAEHPDLNGKSPAEVKSYFAEKYGVTVTNGTGANHGKLFVSADGMGYLQHQGFVNDTMKVAKYARISSAVQARLMGKRAGIDWHPMKKVDAKILRTVEARFLDWKKKQAQTIEKGVQTDITAKAAPTDNPSDTAQERAAKAQQAGDAAGQASSTASDGASTGTEARGGNTEATAAFQDRLSVKVATSAAGAAGVLCIAKGVADKADEIKLQQVIMPLMRLGMQAVTLGNQVMFGGGDASTEQLSFFSKMLNDKNGKSWVSARSIQGELGQPQTGEDADATAKSITKGSPFDFVNEAPFAVPVAAVCSTGGQVLQIALSFLGGPVSALANLAAGAAIGPPVMDALAHWVSGNAVDFFPQGPKYGNYINYGTRLAASDQGLTTGGRKLSNSEEKQLKVAEAAASEQEFQDHSIAYRLLNPYDNRSALSHVIDNTSTSPTQNVNKMAYAFLSIGKSFGSLARFFSGTAHAAAPGYDYPFPTFGFTKEEMNDARFRIPQENAEKTIPILEGASGQSYIDKAKQCFGVNIAKDGDNHWSVTSDAGSVPKYKDIDAANCTDTNLEWLRIRHFIADTETMEANACYEGDDEACTNVGFDTGGAATATTTAPPSESTPPSGSAKDLATQLKQYLDNGKIKCTTSGCPDIVKTASGDSIKGGSGCTVDALNASLLGMLLKLAQMGHTFILSALCSDHHNDGPNGHAGGKAADFNTIDGVFMGPSATAQWTGAKIIAGRKLDQDIASFMPKNTGFGQITCHPTFDFLSGFQTFPDACHHQHVEVEQ